MKHTFPRLVKIAAILFVGCAAGFLIGASLTFKYDHYRHIKYSEALENYYIDGRLFNLEFAMITLANAEDAHSSRIIDDQSTVIRSLFLAIIRLHKTGCYEQKDAEILRILFKARKFMAARPANFIGQSFYPGDTIPGKTNEIKKDEITKQAADQLQAGYNYIDDLSTTNTIK